MAHTPEWDENVNNLGARKKHNPDTDEKVWYKLDEIPTEKNFQPNSSPDQVLMEKEESEARMEIAKMKKRLQGLPSDDLLRGLLEPKIKKIREKFGFNEKEEKKEEIKEKIADLVLQEENDRQAMKHPRRERRQNEIKKLEGQLQQLESDSDEPEQLAA